MSYSLYFHMPFCQRRCHYCDFYTTTGNEGLIPNYVDALINEFRIAVRGNNKLPVRSVYFGGGTPSLISALGYEKLISAVVKEFALSDDCEISLEANPGTLSLNYLRHLNAIGFNRISLGVQSTDSFDLQRLDRIHTIDEVLSSVYHARMAGFQNINLDLIFGLPWQDLRSWEHSLQRAIQLKPQHFSIYSLIIEPGTPLFGWHERGLITEKNQDLEAEMYELTMAMLKDAGYEHYEISNWRKLSLKEDFRCRHNLQYWRNQPYFGFGANAHGYVDGKRTVNISNLVNYLDVMKKNQPDAYPFPAGPATTSVTPVDFQTKMRDFMMLGLRLVQEGVSEMRFNRLYGKSLKHVFAEELSYLLTHKLIQWEDADHQQLRLTPRGVMIANQVFMQFV